MSTVMFKVGSEMEKTQDILCVLPNTNTSKLYLRSDIFNNFRKRISS